MGGNTLSTATILIHENRWSRLERYARWRSRRLPLHHLPNDVLDIVVGLLARLDFFSFLAAVVGFVPDLNVPQHVAHVPQPIRSRWFHEMVLQTFEFHLSQLADQALFYCKDSTSALALVNWSPFGSSTITPVAEYSWSRTTPVHSNVILHSESLRTIVNRCICKQSCAVRLSLHLHLHWNNQDIINPDPTLQYVYYVYPHHVIPQYETCIRSRGADDGTHMDRRFLRRHKRSRRAADPRPKLH